VYLALGMVVVPAAAVLVIAAVVVVHHLGFVAWHRARGRATPAGLEWMVHEVRDGARVGWWYLRGYFADGHRPGEGRPVLCVHGYSQSGANFFGLRAHLRRPTVAVSLLHRLAPLLWYAARLEARLERLIADHPDGVDVVAHSMGGVVLRVVLASRVDLAARVRTVVTLGTPHRGTAAARWIPVLPELKALRRRSAFLAALPSLVELVPHGRVVTIAAAADTLVYPVETALVPGAEHVVLPDMGHAGLLTRFEAYEAVRLALDP
jgi:triacylglycerol lipase